MSNDFELMVEGSWTRAVMESVHDIERYRFCVLESLRSENPKVRSAAVAVLNEVDDKEAHDSIICLINDSNSHVVDEVFEYLADNATLEDAQILLTSLCSRRCMFSASSALVKLFGNVGNLIDSDDLDEYVRKETENWKRVIENRGLLT